MVNDHAHELATSQLISNVMAGGQAIETTSVMPHFTTNESGVTITGDGEYIAIPIQSK